MAPKSIPEWISCESVLNRFHSDLWHFYIWVPAIQVPHLVEKDRRVICKINSTFEFQCALMPDGNGDYFININKEIRTKLGLKQGDMISFSLTKDNSEYGLPMPDELLEVFKQDPEAKSLFHSLTPGKMRSLLHIIGKPKNVDLRIHRAVAVIRHLQENNGKIIYKQLQEDLKK